MIPTGEAKAAAISENAWPGVVQPVQPQAVRGSLGRDLLYLVKPRLTSLVLLAAMAGFFLASPAELPLLLLLDTLLGTALVAAGASALNQLLERDSDALMRRTRERPLPAGRLLPVQVLAFGVLAALAGIAYLGLRVNANTAFWAALTMATYVAVYTPLKRRTTLNTLVGAVPGALPPLIGWAAADGQFDHRACCLFAIVFIWQLPHFLAIAWIYRDEYKRAGLVMLPTVDPEGCSTGRQIAVHSVSLLPLSLLPFFLRMSGELYFAGAVLLGIAFVGFGLNFSIKRSDAAARQLFLASVAYLPLLLALMMFDKL